MKSTTFYRDLQVTGPGGITCNCCTGRYSAREFKVKCRRWYRRTVGKRVIQEQLNDL